MVHTADTSVTETALYPVLAIHHTVHVRTPIIVRFAITCFCPLPVPFSGDWGRKPSRSLYAILVMTCTQNGDCVRTSTLLEATCVPRLTPFVTLPLLIAASCYASFVTFRLVLLNHIHLVACQPNTGRQSTAIIFARTPN